MGVNLLALQSCICLSAQEDSTAPYSSCLTRKTQERGSMQAGERGIVWLGGEAQLGSVLMVGSYQVYKCLDHFDA